MKMALRRIVSVLLCVWAVGWEATTALGQTAAIDSGDWNDPWIWLNKSTPWWGDDVFIGSVLPDGAASFATVWLSSDQSAASVYLGFGAGTFGTLDLGDSNLFVSDQVYIGYGGGSGTITRGAGSLTAGGVVVDSGNSFDFGPNDAVWNLTLQNNSQAATAAIGNVGGNVWLNSGSKLTLGADMSLAGSFVADDGRRSTLDMGRHALSADTIQLGWDNGGPLTIQNRGPLYARFFSVGHQNFDFIPEDSVSFYDLRNGASKTVAANNITGALALFSNSRLRLGADMSLSGYFYSDGSSRLDMAGHSLNAYAIYLNGSQTIENRSALSAHQLWLNNLSFSFALVDSTALCGLWNSTAQTATTSSITEGVWLENRSRLVLGADMSLSGSFIADDGTAQTLDMRGHSLTANQLHFGWDNGGPVTLQNRGPIFARYMQVGDQAFDFIPQDAVWSYSLRNGASVTAAVGNIRGDVGLYDGSRFTLGADLSLNSALWVEGNSIVDAVRHSISASGIYLGYTGFTPGRLADGGAIYVNELTLANHSTATFHPAGVVQSTISLSNGSVLTLVQSQGDTTGLTLNGTPPGSLGLAIDGGSQLRLDFGDNDTPSWIFRWKDPAGGTWEATLLAMIGDERIAAPHGYRLYDSGGYTYLGSPVPVPATLVGLLQLGGIAAAVTIWRRRRR